MQLLFVSYSHAASYIWILAGKVMLLALADGLSNTKQLCNLCYCPLDISPPP